MPTRGLLITWLLLASAGRAQLVFPEPAIDIGKVKSGVRFSQKFDFVNRGKAPVRIIDVKSSCGCLTPRLDRRSYAPGDAGSIPFEVNTLTSAGGPTSWSARVRYQEAEQTGEKVLLVRAFVEREIEVEPTFLRVFTTGGVKHTIAITDRRPTPLQVTRATTSSTSLLATVDPESTSPWRITVEVLPTTPEGTHEESLLIHTTDPTYSTLQVPITIVKRPNDRIQASPSEVTLTRTPTTPFPSARVLLRTPDARIAVGGITTSHPALTCQLLPTTSSRVLLKIHADHTKLPTPFAGEIRIQCNQPSTQTILLPVTCQVK